MTPDRIDPVRPTYLRAIDAAAKPSSRQAAKETAASRPSRSTDRVELSPEARLLGLRAVEESSGADRSALIERLRAEIASGDYKLDADSIARELRESGDLEQA